MKCAQGIKNIASTDLPSVWTLDILMRKLACASMDNSAPAACPSAPQPWARSYIAQIPPDVEEQG
ncbi:hypothetical protein AO263_14690 [Pseudomonas sp. NZIPFR-PS5]|nr:hypothetical protein AO263_14690 [Pseudomonas sp. NZIPFR-PS5]